MRKSLCSALLAASMVLAGCHGQVAQEADQEPVNVVDSGYRPLNVGATGDQRSVLIRPSALLGVDGVPEGTQPEDFVAAGPATWEVVNFDSAAYDLLRYDVIVVGEFHGNDACHALQQRLLDALSTRRPTMALSMEQFERDEQAGLNRYLRGELDEETFLGSVEQLWGNYHEDYRPMVELAKERGIPVIASNIPRSMASEIFKQGLEISETWDERKRRWMAAEIHLETDAYVQKLYQWMGYDPDAQAEGSDEPTDEATHGHSMDKQMVDRLVAAQISKDDTMAESIVQYLQAYPGHLVMHTCGAFHSDEGLGVVERIRLRMPGVRIAVISPIHQEEPLNPDVRLLNLKQGDYLLAVTNQQNRPVPAEEEKAEEQPASSQAQEGAETNKEGAGESPSRKAFW